MWEWQDDRITVKQDEKPMDAPWKPFVVLDNNTFCGVLHVQNTVATRYKLDSTVWLTDLVRLNKT